MRQALSRVLVTLAFTAGSLSLIGCPSGTDDDLCLDVTCAAPAATCEGETAVSYTGVGTCQAADGSCDYGSVEVRTDCAARSQTCTDGACTGGDLCANVTCPAPGAACDMDTAVSYSGDGSCDPTDGTCDYSAVEMRTDCTTNGQTCDTSTNACTTVDLCAGVTCPAPGGTCDADTSVSYTGDGTCVPADGSCDYSAVEVREDCTTNGGTCDILTKVCVADLCASVTCAPPGDSCDGNTEVSYSGDGTCVPADGSCDYSAVEVRLDCTTGGGTCDATTNACIGVDPCFGVDCSQPADTCDVNVAVTYSAAGVCDGTSGTGVCDFSAVETRTDCTPSGATCVNAACVVVLDAPAPGELVITEIIQNPNAVGDTEGEWFEVLSLATVDRDLEGLTIADQGSDSYTIATGGQLVIAPGQYFVFGRNADSTVNGGVTVDHEYAGFTLGNGADEVVILGLDGTTVIDEVVYDGGTLFPDPTGASMQFGNDYDPATDDNNLGSNWCIARDAYGAGDLGTPGSSNGDCNIAATTVTIYELNDVTATNHPSVNVPVIVQGVVVTANVNGEMWVQEAAGGPFSGLYVIPGTVDVTAAVRGSLVDLEGTYSEDGPFGGTDKTQLALTAITVTGAGTLPANEVLPTSTFADPATAEPWENVLVEVREVGVTAVLQFEVSLDANVLVNDLLYAPATPLTDCDVIDYVIGPLNYSYGTFKIEPRDVADMGTINANTVSAAPGAVDIASFAFSPASYCVPAATDVTWTNQDAAQHSVVERDPLEVAPNNIPATPAFDSGLLAQSATWTMTAPTAGTYHYRCRPHAAMEGRLIVLE